MSLVLEDIRVSLDGRELLAVDTMVGPDAPLTLMGPSGSGKSSLLAFLGGFLPPAFTVTGRALLAGETITDLPSERRHLGLLFQDPLLFPHMSVAGNLLFSLPRGGTRAARRGQVDGALEDIGLGGYGDRDPATLSGGQKARVALMRVLLSQPRALLLDEPFSKLDTQLRGQIRDLVFERARAENLPVVMVTHDAEDAAAAGGQVVTL